MHEACFTGSLPASWRSEGLELTATIRFQAPPSMVEGVATAVTLLGLTAHHPDSCRLTECMAVLTIATTGPLQM